MNKNMDKKIFILAFGMVLILLAPLKIMAFPRIPAEYYGLVTLNWSDASIGSNVTAYDSDGVLCGHFIVSNTGYYGLLSCKGDNPLTSADEGADTDNITFFVNNQRAVMFGNTTWKEGSFKEVNISAQNYAPFFMHNLTLQTVNESSTLIYDVNCSDLNYWDNLTYYDDTSLFDINTINGIINWTPDNEHVGNHSIRIMCSDTYVNTSGILDIVVEPINHAPILTPIGNKIAVEGEVFIYNVNATDSDGDNLTYYDNTSFFNINPVSGLISFTPTLSQIGNYSIKITVSDGLLSDYEIISFRIVRAPFCGDGSCGSDETCLSCPQDCGVCPTLPTQPGSGGGGTGEGFGALSIEEIRALYPSICQEKWECTEWSACTKEGNQTRECIDINKCGTKFKKPEEIRECIYEGDCFDGIKNCHDGSCEEDIDCDGPCPACSAEPSCFDGIKNCHDGSCEEDIDCDGPCEPCEKRKYAALPDFEMPAKVINFPWFMLFLILIIVSLTVSGDQLYIRKITTKDFEKFRESMAKYRKRRAKIYAMAVIFSLAILIYAFYLFSLQFEENFILLYIGTIATIISGIILFVMLQKKLRYDMQRRREEERRFLETDKRKKENLLRIAEENILNMEMKTGIRVYNLIKSSEYDQDIDILFEKIYSLIRDLCKKRKEKLKPLESSPEINQLINKLGSDNTLIKFSKQYPELKKLSKSIKKLSKCLAKKKIKNELICSLVEDFLFDMEEITADSHIMAVIKSYDELVKLYNELVDIYSYYQEQFDEKQELEKEIIQMESRLMKEVEHISEGSIALEKIKENSKLVSLYNDIMDFYTSYKKKGDIFNQMRVSAKKEEELL